MGHRNKQKTKKMELAEYTFIKPKNLTVYVAEFKGKFVVSYAKGGFENIPTEYDIEQLLRVAERSKARGHCWKNGAKLLTKKQAFDRYEKLLKVLSDERIEIEFN